MFIRFSVPERWHQARQYLACRGPAELEGNGGHLCLGRMGVLQSLVRAAPFYGLWVDPVGCTGSAGLR